MTRLLHTTVSDNNDDRPTKQIAVTPADPCSATAVDYGTFFCVGQLRVRQNVMAALSSSSPTVTDPRLFIHLTDEESSVFNIILSAVTALKLDCQVRVAGGWVRDKLLKVHAPKDIDLVLDTMNGYDFAEALNKYLCTQKHNETSKAHRIKANPAKSKHLETATFRIGHVRFDVNRFRKEVYTANSRIPMTESTSAQADAERRDLTINALFYNLQTGLVEDYVDGVDDLLTHKLLRTPMNSFKTFEDDPLRILRTARFAGQLHFAIHDDIVAAAMRPESHRNIVNKLSSERVGIEADKIIHQQPATAVDSLRIICNWHLRTVIFRVVEPFIANDTATIGSLTLMLVEHLQVPLDPSNVRYSLEDNEEVSRQCLAGLEAALQFLRTATVTSDQASFCLLSSFMMPYCGYRVDVRKQVESALVYRILVESLVFSKVVAETVSSLIDSAAHIVRLVQLRFDQPYLVITNEMTLAAAAILERTNVNIPLLMCAVDAHLRVFYHGNETITRDARWFVDWMLNDLALDRAVWNVKMLDGNELMAEINIPPGEQVRVLSEKMVLYSSHQHLGGNDIGVIAH